MFIVKEYLNDCLFNWKIYVIIKKNQNGGIINGRVIKKTAEYLEIYNR